MEVNIPAKKPMMSIKVIVQIMNFTLKRLPRTNKNPQP